jgi:glycosyltransferase involved in cell wall biosynthesis
MNKVSVIIPTWNRAEETERAVQSVLHQTYQNFEVIIADDGSTDSTPLKFKDYPDPRVHYLQLEHSGLPAVPRNAALRQAQGEFAAFLDSDDEWLPDKLDRQLEVFIKDPEVGMVCSNARVRHGKMTEPGSLFHTETIGSQAWPLAELVKTNIIIASSLLVIRLSVIEAGGFPQDPVFRAIEDYALWLRLAVKIKLFYLAEPLLIYADVGDSLRSLQRKGDQPLGLLRMFDELAIFMKSEPAAVQKNLNIRRVGCLKNLLRIASENRKIKDVIYCARRILTLEPGNIQNYGLICSGILRAITSAS